MFGAPKLKYIMYEDLTFLILPDHIKHSTFPSVEYKKAVSAGFVDISDNQVCCYGESVSLKLKANEKDGEVIKRYITNEF